MMDTNPTLNMNAKKMILEAMLATARMLRERAPNTEIAQAALDEEKQLSSRLRKLVPQSTPPQPEGLAA